MTNADNLKAMAEKQRIPLRTLEDVTAEQRATHRYATGVSRLAVVDRKDRHA